MRNKTATWILILAFCLMLCFSRLAWTFLEPVIRSDNSENRTLTEFPQLNGENIRAFRLLYEEYLDDHLPFRNQLITLHSAVDFFVFHQASDERVLLGKDGWLFYADPWDGNPIACYQGTNLFTEEELKSIGEKLTRFQRECASKKQEFILFIAPNKERIYKEYLPEIYGEPAEEYKALQLVRYLREHTDIEVVYPYGELIKAKKELQKPIWWKLDTHWNEPGAYTAARVLLRAMSIELPELSDEWIQIAETGGIRGDLADMLNLRGWLKDMDREYRISDSLFANLERQEKTVFVIRDSFGDALRRFVDPCFFNTVWIHRDDYLPERLKEAAPNAVVYETVERYLDKLLEIEL